jgi:hypothetical protein
MIKSCKSNCVKFDRRIYINRLAKVIHYCWLELRDKIVVMFIIFFLFRDFLSFFKGHHVMPREQHS